MITGDVVYEEGKMGSHLTLVDRVGFSFNPIKGIARLPGFESLLTSL